ncbi:MAG: c-type cytochrome, partial [Gammaproteobacteria bacterium]|nr:c-type cytochrome [Gammaproteobacteria bacterium]
MNNKFIQFTSLVLLSVLFSMTTMAADMTVGEKTYQQACAMCHASGVANAPILGKKSDWVERSKKGTEALVNSAINGLGAMPAKGGQAQLSDSDVAAAVDFMLIALDKEEPAESAAVPLETKPLV